MGLGPQTPKQFFLLCSERIAWDSNYKGPVFLDAEALG